MQGTDVDDPEANANTGCAVWEFQWSENPKITTNQLTGAKHVGQEASGLGRRSW